MARLPVAGRVKTRLVPPLTDAEAARLYAAFLEDMSQLGAAAWERTLFWVREPGDGALPVAPTGWHSAWQSGGDLGDRLEAAFEDLFQRGGPVVLVGSDHPDLPPAVLGEALQALAASGLVLGPTPDGGYYLIGLRSPAPGLLRGIRWSTRTVYEETQAAATARGLPVGRLREWADVDTWEDARQLARRLAGREGRAPNTRRVLGELGVPEVGTKRREAT